LPTYLLSSRIISMAHRIAREGPAVQRTASKPAPKGEASKAGTTRERILDVALELFVRKGYAETSLREIATELGFSKAALYYHFESKQDILLALHMRLHGLSDHLLPLLRPDAAADGDTWERLVDLLIGLALKNRRLIELHIRNRDALAELQHSTALKNHAPAEQHDMETYLRDMLTDPSLPIERRVRRMASVGSIAGVLLSATSLADVPDADLEAALRDVVHDVLRDRPS
jgi:AcrR family transcriptional regulator